MGALSSKPKKVAQPVAPAITSIDRAVLDLKNARDRLQRYRLQLERDDAKLLEQARKAKLENKKERALGILRLRKYKQTQAASCEDQLLNVLQMVETIGSKQNDHAVLDALAAGKDTLKKMHEERTVEDVLELMDQVKEEIDVEQEINEILQGVPSLSPADEEAVEAELAALQEADAVPSEKLPELPQVPTTKLPEPQTVIPEKKPVSNASGRVAVPA